jgi:hypothetical protein
MRIGGVLRAACACLWLAGSGCTALREIPRSDYAARPERRRVRVQTRDGRLYEFDSARFDSDSLYGTTRRDVEGPTDEIATFSLALDDVSRISSREVDWYRTGLVGGGVIAGVVAAGLSARGSGKTSEPPPIGPRLP